MREDVLLKARFEPQGTAAKILDAAEQVFSEHGYAGTSTREVARRAQVPFGALHYHWGSKKQLWDAVFRRLADRTRDTIIGNFTPGRTIGALLDNLVDAFLDFFAEHRTVVRLCYRASLEAPELHREIHSMFTELEALGRNILRQLVPNLAIDAQAAIFVLTNAFIASCRRAVPGGVRAGASSRRRRAGGCASNCDVYVVFRIGVSVMSRASFAPWSPLPAVLQGLWFCPPGQYRPPARTGGPFTVEPVTPAVVMFSGPAPSAEIFTGDGGRCAPAKRGLDPGAELAPPARRRAAPARARMMPRSTAIGWAYGGPCDVTGKAMTGGPARPFPLMERTQAITSVGSSAPCSA
jgi:AcrR family transcriptional regulator